MSEKREIYKKNIIKQLYFRNTLSCADISERINKSLPLTTKIVQELIKDEYVIETGYAPSSGGRRPVTYTLKPDVLYIVSIAMDQYLTRIVIMNMENQHATPVEQFELNLLKNDNALAELTSLIINYVNKSGIPKNKILGIGIGMPGFVDVLKGVNYSFFEAGEINIPAYIAERTGLDVFIDNDSSLIALAELRFGKAINRTNAMVINIGWGIGLGLILNNNLFRGNNGFAGEFSHLSLFQNERLCSVCGKTGCLETETSLAVLVEEARRLLQGGQASILKNQVFDVSTEEAFAHIIKAAKKGDKVAVELFSEAGYKIGQGVAILIHLLNPEVVILSGRGSAAGKIWQAPIQQALNEHCIPRLAAATEIVISDLGNDAELIGSAALVMENFEQTFANEVLAHESIEDMEQVVN